MAIDIVLRLLGQDGGGKKVLDDARKSGEALDKQMSKVGGNTGIAALESRVKDFGGALDDARGKTEALDGVMERTRNWGIGIAAAGAAMVLLSNHLISVYQEGARADEKLSAMLEKRGEGSAFETMAKWAGELADKAALVDDDPIKEAAAGLLGFGLNSQQIMQIMPGLIGQSRLYGQSLDSVSMAFGKAFASGNAGALKKSGVTISQADIDYIDAATTEVEKQQRMFEKVKESMDKYALSITQGMSESEIAAAHFAKSMDDAQTALGKGAAGAQSALANVGARLLTVVGANPGVAEQVGLWGTYAAYVLSGVGSLVAMGGQLGQASLALMAMRDARAANSAADDVDTVSKGANTLATNDNALAQMTLAEASMAAKLGVAAIGIAAAATVAYVGYAIGQHLGWINNELTAVEALSLGWKDLGDRIGLTSNAAVIARNEIDANKNLEAAKVKNAQDADKGLITRAEEEKRNRDAELFWAQRKAEAAKRLGDDATYLKEHEAAARLKAQAQAPAMPSAMLPALPPPAAPPALPTTGAAASVAAMPGAPDSADDGSGLTKAGKKQQADAVKAAAKADRAAAKNQKDIDRANLKEARALEKIAKAKEKRADKLEDYQADIEKAKVNDLAETQIAQLEAARSKGGDAGIDSRIASIKAAQEKKIADIDARAIQDDDPQRANSIRQIAAIHAQGMLNRAGIGKATQSGGRSASDVIAALRSGGGMAALGNGSGTSASGGSGGASTSGGTVTAEVQGAGYDAVGNWIVQFRQIVIPPPRIAQAAGRLRS